MVLPGGVSHLISDYRHLGLDYFLVVGTVLCTASISGFCVLDATNFPAPSPAVTTKIVFRNCQMSPGQGAKFPLVESHWCKGNV